MTQMTEQELTALTDLEIRNAVGYYGGKLAEQRRKAEYFYLGLAKGELAPAEIDGRSSVVSPDVRNTIESMLPQLMVKFCGGDTVVEFEPTRQDDEEKAQVCTDYINYLFFKRNNGHKLAYTWIKDALIQKVGIVKVWWDNRTEETREEYKALSDVELAELMDDEEIEVTEQRASPDQDDAEQRQEALAQIAQQMQAAQQAEAMGNPQAQQAVMQMQARIDQIQGMPPKMVYDVTCKRSKKGGKVTIENVPPEEFLISRKAKDIATASFVGHRVLRTMSDLKSMGYKNIENLSGDDSAASYNAERIERLSFDDEMAYLNFDSNTTDESQKQVWITECYIRCDYDGDGISELRKVVRCGNEILENEMVDVAPFVSICPIPLPHKFFGLSIADLGFEGQKTKTAILRGLIDNMHLQINGRYFAVEGQVNLDDLLTSRPGGTVRMKAPGMAGRLDQGMGDTSYAMNMMEYMEDFLENSTGWTRYSQGTDSKGLNNTATGINIITNKADMRVDLIARNMAEGFVELFKMMLRLVTQNEDRENIVRIAGKWVKLDPREWRNQFDVGINVGLGVGNKDQQVAHLMNLKQAQVLGLQIGTATPVNVYEADKELSKLMGFKSGDKFFTDPREQPPKPPQPNPEMLKVQGQMQIEQAKQQHEAQLEQIRMQAQQQIDIVRQQAEREQHDYKIQAEAQLKQFEAQMQAQIEQERIASQERIANMKGQFDLAIEQMRSQTSLRTSALASQPNQDVQFGDDGNITVAHPLGELLNKVDQSLAVLAGGQQLIAEHLARPKMIIRDASGRAAGVK